MVIDLETFPCFKNLEFDVSFDVPIGWRFRPTEEELIVSYLSRKVASESLPAQIIPEIDATEFYTKHPNFFVDKSCLERDPWYLLIHNEEYFDGKIRKTKVVGEDEEEEEMMIGWWKSNGKEEEICDADGNVFACKIHYTFFTNSRKTHWKMELYRLPSHHHKNLSRDEWVVARIKRV